MVPVGGEGSTAPAETSAGRERERDVESPGFSARRTEAGQETLASQIGDSTLAERARERSFDQMESVSTVPELRWDKLIVGVAAPRVSCLGGFKEESFTHLF